MVFLNPNSLSIVRHKHLAQASGDVTLFFYGTFLSYNKIKLTLIQIWKYKSGLVWFALHSSPLCPVKLWRKEGKFLQIHFLSSSSMLLVTFTKPAKKRRELERKMMKEKLFVFLKQSRCQVCVSKIPEIKDQKTKPFLLLWNLVGHPFPFDLCINHTPGWWL